MSLGAELVDEGGELIEVGGRLDLAADRPADAIADVDEDAGADRGPGVLLAGVDPPSALCTAGWRLTV